MDSLPADYKMIKMKTWGLDFSAASIFNIVFVSVCIVYGFRQFDWPAVYVEFMQVLPSIGMCWKDSLLW
jgi:hypothetical protein